MKLKLSELKLTAIDKATGNEYGVRGWRTGPLDKNQTGSEVILDHAHNGCPIPRRWDEVDVSIEMPMKIRWEEEMFTLKGYIGNRYIFKIWLTGDCGYEIESTLSLAGCYPKSSYASLEQAKEYAQRLFDEWMGGLMNG